MYDPFKITFVYPDFENLGIQYLMSICKRHDYEVDYVYYQVKDMYLSIGNGKDSSSKVAQKVKRTEPQVVAFSCTTGNFRSQLSIARELKENSDLVTVFGGIHPTSVPYKVINKEEVDCVAIGEADISFLKFLDNCRYNQKDMKLPPKPVKGMIFEKGGSLIGNYEEGELIDLNNLPFPEKESLPPQLKDAVSYYKIMTSRGCPYGCSYCFNSYMKKLRGKCVFRQRSVENVIREIKRAKELYPLKYILFLDDCFTMDSEWIFEFCSRYRKEIKLPFWFLTHPLSLNRKKIYELNLAGCVSATIGVQSLSQRINKDILHRKSKKDKIKKVIKNLREFGIMVKVDHMLGIPTDTLRLQEKSILFYNQVRPDVISIYWLNFYPKTAVTEYAFKKGYLTEEDIENIEPEINKKGIMVQGGVKVAEEFYGIALLMSYLPLLPPFVVEFLVKNKWYRALKLKRFYYPLMLIARFGISISKRRNFIDRRFVIRLINRLKVYWKEKLNIFHEKK